jgi:hypothetical protein
MDTYEKIIVKIIQAQEAIIGPVAIERARQVKGLNVADWSKQEVEVTGDEEKIVSDLINVYKELFGQISVEVSKEAAGALTSELPAGHVPVALK